MQLCDAWNNSRQLTVACTDRIEPLIGIYPIRLADSISELAESDDRSLYRWMAGQEHTALPCPADHLHNINSSEDLSNHGLPINLLLIIPTTR